MRSKVQNEYITWLVPIPHRLCKEKRKIHFAHDPFKHWLLYDMKIQDAFLTYVQCYQVSRVLINPNQHTIQRKLRFLTVYNSANKVDFFHNGNNSTYLTQKLYSAKLPKHAVDHEGTGVAKNYNHFSYYRKHLNWVRGFYSFYHNAYIVMKQFC